MIGTIIKRDGRTMEFNLEKISQAIFKAAQAIGGKDYEQAKQLAVQVQEELEKSMGNLLS